VPRPGPALGEEQVHFTRLCGEMTSQGRYERGCPRLWQPRFWLRSAAGGSVWSVEECEFIQPRFAGSGAMSCSASTVRLHRFRGSNHIDIVNLVLRSAFLRASRRTATGEIVPAPSFETPRFARLLRMRSVDWIRSCPRSDRFHGINPTRAAPLRSIGPSTSPAIRRGRLPGP
jgi:hypothetical protein